MDNIINLKQKHIERIERKASEEYGVVKIAEDSYIVPANVTKTSDMDMSFMNEEMYLDEELKWQIKAIDVEDGDYIAVSCNNILDDNYKLLEAVVVRKSEIYELTIKSDLLYEDRDKLLNMIAYLHKDKELYLTFYLHYDFNLLEGLFDGEE